MLKALPSGAVAAALLAAFAATSAASAAAAASRADAPAWVVTPVNDACRTELELTGASGGTAPVVLVSDGETVNLVFAKADAPERAFLPIRIDHKPYPNLVLRQADAQSAAMQLSAETLAALRKGASLQISWLADEPVQTSLAGSEQGLADLRTCGAQVAQRFRDQQAAARDAKSRTDAETRAKALADEQFAAAKAQKDAADAEARRSAAEAEHLRAEAAAERQRAQQAADAAARERADEQAQADDDPYYPRQRGYPNRGGYYQQDPYSYYPQQPYRGW